MRLGTGTEADRATAEVGGGAIIFGGGPFPEDGDTPVKLVPHAWHVVVPIGFTSPHLRHL
jgi:hypothetical protein